VIKKGVGMSTGFRIFFIEEGDHIRRISNASFNDFYLKEEKKFPEYAGKKFDIRASP
jgi:hypothetical protein